VTKTKPSEEHKPNGRPSDYSPDVAAELLSRLVERSLRKVCADEDMPSASTFFRWLGANPEFREQYDACARARADAMFEEMFEIADDGRGDVTVTEDGREIVNWENIQRSKLRVDTRKWALAKMMPRKYGERLETAPPQNQVLSAAQQIKRALDDIEATVPVDATAQPAEPTQPPADKPGE